MARRRATGGRRRRARAPRRGPRASLRPRQAKLPPLAWALIALTLLVVANTLVQVARKPTELLGLVVSPSPLTPEQTWARYGPACRDHSTGLVRPELLAALVQVESAGDPLARTYWRWRWTLDPFRVWAPASSAVGILQITDGTYDEARHYCVHDHQVIRDDGPWGDRCWLNALYFRTVPSHAIEMTAAWLHLGVAEALERVRVGAPTRAQRDALAAAIHLCGRGRGAALAARGFRPEPGERCGDHDLRGYLEHVRALAGRFEQLER
jgi:hypothetical protein